MASPSQSRQGIEQSPLGAISADFSAGEGGSRPGVLAEGCPGPTGEDTASWLLPQPQRGGTIHSPSQEGKAWEIRSCSLCLSLTPAQQRRSPSSEKEILGTRS